MMDVTVSYMHADGKTTGTVSCVGYGHGAKRAVMSWEQAFDKLKKVLVEG